MTIFRSFFEMLMYNFTFKYSFSFHRANIFYILR